MSSFARFAASLVLITTLFCVARPPASEAAPSPTEKLLLDAANRERSARGLGLLQWDDALARAARQHAQLMAQQRAIAHQFPGEPDLLERVRRAGARFQGLEENVAEGPSAAGLHEQWMNSPPHRENLLNPQMNALGAAIEQRGNVFYGVEDFSLAVAAVSLEEQENQLASELQSKDLRLVKDDGEALRLCQGQRPAPERRGNFFVRFSAAGLENLPDLLTRQLQSGRFRAAAVAACGLGQDENGFSMYQFGVVLFE